MSRPVKRARSQRFSRPLRQKRHTPQVQPSQGIPTRVPGAASVRRGRSAGRLERRCRRSDVRGPPAGAGSRPRRRAGAGRCGRPRRRAPAPAPGPAGRRAPAARPARSGRGRRSGRRAPVSRTWPRPYVLRVAGGADVHGGRPRRCPGHRPTLRPYLADRRAARRIPRTTAGRTHRVGVLVGRAGAAGTRRAACDREAGAEQGQGAERAQQPRQAVEAAERVEDRLVAAGPVEQEVRGVDGEHRPGDARTARQREREHRRRAPRTAASA